MYQYTKFERKSIKLYIWFLAEIKGNGYKQKYIILEDQNGCRIRYHDCCLGLLLYVQYAIYFY